MDHDRTAARDALVGRPADSLWDLFRAEDHTPPTAGDLFAASARHRVPMLGWDPCTDEPVPWGGTHGGSHLGIHGPATRQVQMDHMGLLVAVQLHKMFGRDAVTVVDADPATVDDDPEHWTPLREAGMCVYSLVEDPGKAVGAMAAVADTARARSREGYRGDGVQFLVLLGRDTLVPLAGAYSPGYAAAARDALRLVLAFPISLGVGAVVTTASPPGADPGWSGLQAPAPGDHEWVYRATSWNGGRPVEVPQVVPTWWLSERLVAVDAPLAGTS